MLWDQDAIAEELHTGTRRAEFVHEVEIWAARNQRELTLEYRMAPATDFAWKILVSAITEIAAKFFAREQIDFEKGGRGSA